MRSSELGQQVRERQDELLSADAPDDAVRERLAERAAGRSERQRRRHNRRRFALALAAVALPSTFLFLVLRNRPVDVPPASNLSFTVAEAPGVLNAWISATDDSVPLHFSDGSQVQLRPDARGRVVRLTPSGADVVLEAGKARVDVVKQSGAAWQVRSGPFIVHVQGTRFDVGWNPARDEFELSLYEGRVSISGCGFVEGQELRGGQRARASCRAETLSIAAINPSAASSTDSARPQDGSARPSETAPAAATSDAVSRGTVADAPLSPPPGDDSLARPRATQRSPAPAVWAELARAGRYADAFEAVNRAGFENECQQGDAESVALLGKIARLSGHPERARHAYTVVRTRFGNTRWAARAAFELGRLEAANAPAVAARWFQTYLDEQPTGPLAALALGRLLESHVAMGDAAAARDVARRYLERYPNGPHETAARQVLDAAPSP